MFCVNLLKIQGALRKYIFVGKESENGRGKGGLGTTIAL